MMKYRATNGVYVMQSMTALSRAGRWLMESYQRWMATSKHVAERKMNTVLTTRDVCTRHFKQGVMWTTTRQEATQISVVAGEVWITQTGDREDHLLLAGQTRIFRAGAKIVVQAMTDASVELTCEAQS